MKEFYATEAYQKLQEKVLPIVGLGFLMNFLSILSLVLFLDSVEKCRPFVIGFVCAATFYAAIAIVWFVYDVWGVHEYGE